MCTTLSSTEPFLASKLMTTLLQNQILHSCVRYNHMSRLPMRFGKCRLGETWRHYGGPRTLVKQGNYASLPCSPILVDILLRAFPPSVFCLFSKKTHGKPVTSDDSDVLIASLLCDIGKYIISIMWLYKVIGHSIRGCDNKYGRALCIYLLNSLHVGLKR